MRKRFLQFMAGWIYRHPWLVLAGAALAAAAAGLLVSRLRLEVEILDLLPRDSPIVRTYFAAAQQFGLADRMVIVLQSETPIDVEAVSDAVDQFAANLRSSELLREVEWRLQPTLDESLIGALRRHFTLFLTPESAAELDRRLTPVGMEAELERMRLALLSGAGPAVSRELAADPLGVLRDLARLPEPTDRTGRFRIVDGYLLTPDLTRMVLLAQPVAPSQDMPFVRRLDAEVRQAWQQALAEAGVGPGGPAAGLALRLTGLHEIALEESRLIKRDVVLTAASSLVAILVIFGVAFRSLRSLLLVGPPLALGTVLGLAAGALAYGALNLVTSVCSAVVIGLGIDYAIHIYARFQDERSAGLDGQTALEKALGETGAGVVDGAVTSAAAFYVMMLTDFRGIAEFGFITGTGILACLVTMLTVLPALIALTCRPGVPAARHIRLRSFGLRELSRLVEKHPRWILAAGLAVGLVALWKVPAVHFNDDLQSMRSRGNQAMQLRDEIRPILGESLRPTMLVVRGVGADELETAEDEALRELQPLRQAGILATVDSLGRYLPPLAERRQVRARLAHDFPPERIADLPGVFEQALRESGLRSGPAMTAYIEDLVQALAERGRLDLDGLDEGALGTLLGRYYHDAGDGGESLALYLYPTPEAGSRSRGRLFVGPVRRALAGLSHPYDLTGVDVLIDELKSRIRDSFRSVTALVAVTVLAILIISLHGLKPALLAMLPLASGIVWMLGAMGWFGLELNYFNIFVVAMILGIGIDYGVHLIHRVRLCDELRPALIGSGKAITMSALTTIAGFGSLVLADYQALASLGWVAILGVSFCCIASLTMLPALLAVLARRWRASAPEPGAP